jgi:hypothetical protein
MAIDSNYSNMSDRDILVSVATKITYLEKSINTTNQDIEKKMEMWRQLLNDCNHSHCIKETELETRLNKIETFVIKAGVIGGLALGVLFTFKDEILALIFKI